MRVLTNENLFAIIKKHPLLYDQTHEDYKNGQKREKLWCKIATAYGENVDEIKKRWKSLKDTYAKHIRRCQSQPRTKKWIWADQMKFFLPYLNYASRYGNAIDIDSDNGPDIECEETILDNDERNEVAGNYPQFGVTMPKEEYLLSASSFDDKSVNYNSTERNSPEPLQQSTTSAIFTISNGVAAVKRRHNTPEEHQVPNAQEDDQVPNVQEEHQVHNRPRLEYDDNESILLAYAKTIKKFSPKRQAMTRFKIAQILMEQELLHIEESEAGTRGNSTDKC